MQWQLSSAVPPGTIFFFKYYLCRSVPSFTPLHQLRYIHLSVNHSNNFTDPDKDICKWTPWNSSGHWLKENWGRCAVYNYPPKGRWIVVDIYRDAKRRGIYPLLFTDPEGDSSFSIYQIRWIRKCCFNFFFWNFCETTHHFSFRSQNSE